MFGPSTLPAGESTISGNLYPVGSLIAATKANVSSRLWPADKFFALLKPGSDVPSGFFLVFSSKLTV